MFQIFTNTGVPCLLDGFSARAIELHAQYSRENYSVHSGTRRDPNMISVIRELGTAANAQGAFWVIVDLDHRYIGRRYRVRTLTLNHTEIAEIVEIFDGVRVISVQVDDEQTDSVSEYSILYYRLTLRPRRPPTKCGRGQVQMR